MQELVLPYHKNFSPEIVLVGELPGVNWREEILRVARSAPGAIEAIELQFSPRGKPSFGLNLPWHFNVSNTTALTLAAFALSEVGLDVERLDRGVRAIPLARRYFSRDEAAWVESAPVDEINQRFLALWTAKEALVKLDGSGLASGLARTRIALPCEPDRAITAGFLGQRRACLRQFIWPGDYLVCVAAWEEFELAWFLIYVLPRFAIVRTRPPRGPTNGLC
jgi:phosphopantetheinyl transferase